MFKYMLILCLCPYATHLSARQHTVIEGEVTNPSDSKVFMRLYKYIDITEDNELSTDLTKGKFKFTFDLKDPAYFDLFTNNLEWKLLLIEPGDSIHIAIPTNQPNGITFTGMGAALQKYQYEANTKFSTPFRAPVKPTAVNFTPYFFYIDSCTGAELSFLQTFQGVLSATAYQILKADIIYDGEFHKTNYFFNVMISPDKKAVNELYFSYLDQRQTLSVNDTTANSRNLIMGLMQQNEFDYGRLYNIDDGKFSFAGKYGLLKALTFGSVQERVLAILLLNQVRFNLDAALTSLDDYLKGPYRTDFKEVIRKRYDFQQRFGTGKPAVSFSLPDIHDSIKGLSDFKGKIVLVDFWFNGCVGCASLFKAMTYVKDHFKDNKDVVFINISVDVNKEHWLDGIRLYNLHDEVNLFTMGQGEAHPIIKSYGISAYPSQFLIDKQGKYISATPPRADNDNGKALIQLIESSLAKD